MTEQRRLAAIVSADVAGYSRLMGRDESGTLAALKAIRQEVVDPAIAKHGGRIVKTTGDGLLLEFPSVVNAVRCAIEVQTAMADRGAEIAEDRRFALRIGINLGDIIVEGDDIFGDGVNVAARLQEIAPAGGICISSRVHDDVRDRLDTAFDDGGTQALKNIARPIQVWRWHPGLTALPEPVPAPTALPLPDKPSIAVLPFQNISGDPEQEYFVDGLVEDIITSLSRFKSLFVIARNSTFTYKGKAVDIREAGQQLGVRYVLEGSVRKAANRLRINGQLIDVSTGGHLWADHFDGVLEDVFDLQDRVTSSVVGTIAPKLERAETERALRKPPESLDAYDCFLRGMAHYHLFTRNDMPVARQFFHRATDLDPAYAAAYGLGSWCVSVCQANGWLSDPQREVPDAVELARRAVAIGLDDPLALVTGAATLATLAGELDSAIAYVDRALVLNPNLALAWSVSGWGRVYLGEHVDAITRLERAIRLSPLDLLAHHFYTGMGWAHLFAGRYDEAASWARKAALEKPDWAPTARVETIACALSGRTLEAQKALARLLAITPDLRLSNTRMSSAWRREKDRALYMEGLRLAGLPE
ncbi:adenylate/guanylate cyclase domain-containing protein [Reyranella soli]|uniref:Adenylate cyclase n=1 Tax=Reyranella soli TaxID=1230389 RepID=A0A512NSK9_9HYPH|nr:adenylate/guanylate cyclase domain-containing protein [Reyranella soli]GEP61892.1 adenylate cyclase [Reyranella soli]